MHSARRLPDAPRLKVVTRSADLAIADLARRQHGVITTRQLAELGLRQRAVSHRAAAGRLHRIHQGVYAVGHPLLSLRGRWMAATLTCGSGAVLSHAAAAALWELRATSATTIDVTVPTAGGRRRRAGLRVHRDPALAADEVTVRDGIPVTTPARTILDLAARLSERELERLLDQAEVERLADMFSFDAVLAKHAGHHRAAKLGRTLAHHAPGTTLTKSELEERFLAVCRAHGLPQPRVNATVAGLEADFVFDAPHRLVVETDGWRYHGTRAAFERDRARDARLARARYRTLRFTDRQIAHDAEMVADTIAIALGQSRAA
jgi:predicted transcriptional regulator of viral defense system/very-short-patch-repair endonuclease